MAPVKLKYRAFLSYSHANARQAKWLHGALEGFRIDKQLVGRVTSRGKVPASLRPVFRDRDEFTAGQALSVETLAAIDASAALIVLCSPEAARSAYVNEEVRLFRSRHPGRPVIPAIVAGTPGHPTDECFPPALRFQLDAMGNISSYPAEVLAADIRDDADGRSLALAKIVARLLGLGTDEVFRRAVRARRRAILVRNAVIAALALFGVVATATTVYAVRTAQESEESHAATLNTVTGFVGSAVAMAEQYGVPRFATLSLLKQAESVVTSFAIRQNSSPRMQVQKAWMLLAFARYYELLGDTGKWHEKAHEAAQLLDMLHMQQPRDDIIARDLSVAHNRVGDALRVRGDLRQAELSYRNASTIIRRLARDNPDMLDFQRDLSITYDKIGDVRAIQGDLATALESYRASFGFADLLAKSAPDNDAVLQRDLTVLHNKIGDVLAPRGDLAQALVHYRQALAIAERLLAATPNDAGRQRDQAIATTNVGNVMIEQGDLEAGRAAIQSAQTIWARLADKDADNRRAQSDLGGGRLQVADVRRLGADLKGATAEVMAAREIRTRLAEYDGANSDWQRDLAAAEDALGELQRAAGSLTEALERHDRARSIRERLAASEPGHAETLRGLAFSSAKAADVLVDLGRVPAALERANQALALRRRLLGIDAANAYWRFDLSGSHESIGDVRRAQRQWPAALASYRAASDIRRQLSESAPGFTSWPRDTVIAETKACTVLVEMGDASAALAAASSAIAIAERLAPLDRAGANAVWQRNHAQALFCLGEAHRIAGDLDAAQSSYETAARLQRGATKGDDAHTAWSHELALIWQRLGVVAMQKGRLDAALDLGRRSRELLRAVVTRAPGHVVFVRDLAAAEALLANAGRPTKSGR